MFSSFCSIIELGQADSFMQLVGILCSIGTALLWAMAVIMFKMSGDVLSPTALNLFKGIVTLLLLAASV